VKQYITQHLPTDKFTIYGPDGSALDAAAKQRVYAGAAVIAGSYQPGSFHYLQWRECLVDSPLFGELDAMGAIVVLNGTPVCTMGNTARRVVDIRRLDVLDWLIDHQPTIIDEPWFMDNTMPTFRAALHGGANWIDPGEYSVAVIRVFEHIKERFPTKRVLWNGATYKYPDYLVAELMGIAEMTRLEKPRMSWTAPPTAAELSDLARYMRLANQYGDRLAVTVSPTSEPGTPGWLPECWTAMALVTIASPNSPFAIQQNYSSLYLVEPPWDDLGEPVGPMVEDGNEYGREFDGGTLWVDVAKGKWKYGKSYPMWLA